MRFRRAALAAVAAVGLVLPAAPRAEDHREPFRNLPSSRELLYLPERYAACIPCHPRPLVEEEDFNVDTGFRDAPRGKNLHWMHVLRQPQGTNCSACHVVDGTGGKLSYRPEVGFAPSPAGGSCTPPCHRPKTFRNLGLRPEAAPPTPPARLPR